MDNDNASINTSSKGTFFERIKAWGKEKWLQIVLSGIANDLSRGNPHMMIHYEFVAIKNILNFKLSDGLWNNSISLAKIYGWKPMGAVPIVEDIAGFSPIMTSGLESTYTLSKYRIIDVDVLQLQLALLYAQKDILVRYKNGNIKYFDETKIAIVINFLRELHNFMESGSFLIIKHAKETQQAT